MTSCTSSKGEKLDIAMIFHMAQVGTESGGAGWMEALFRSVMPISTAFLAR